ncbi:MAG: NAD(P)-binding domain-containing protein [candidate division KSB1 bacterium]|nr:NAD(P)-binding domain-containing protein [candidate division KSB1 bacterium]MDZ7301993.1 NAD(P)-binding domain-containing protein [candidate division KSB1 bacterium]MDZ7310175.1 NAD(P)-binding domain-containing protein [candidate division KSB1 bacterium]
MTELLLVVAIAALVILWKLRQRARQDQLHQIKLEQNQRDEVKIPPSLHPLIDTDRCIGCGSCVQACPEGGVLGLVKAKALLLQPDYCVGHGKCEAACPVGAISLVLGTSEHGVEVPVTDEYFQTNVSGLYVIGELGGIGLIRNSVLQGIQCLEAIATKTHQKTAQYDVIIVGAGPAGLGATLQAAAKKLHYLTLEQDEIGGAILRFPRRKVVMTAPVKLPIYGKIQFRDVSKEDLLQEWRRIIQKTGIKIHTRKHVNKIRRVGPFFEVFCQGECHTAANVILALGRRGAPRKLGVPGEHLDKVLYQLDDPQDYVGRNCLVVGGGDSALECALMLAESGARVWLSYRQKTITRAKPRNRRQLEEAVARGKIRALLPSIVTEITPQSVRVQMDGVERNIANDIIFIMAGGVMPVELLRALGIEMRTLYGEPLPSAASNAKF